MNVRRWYCRRRGHRWLQHLMVCGRCGLSHEELRRGRDQAPPRTWVEHDAAVEKAWRAGEEFGRLAALMDMRERTRRAYLLGKLRMFRHGLMALYGPGGQAHAKGTALDLGRRIRER